MPDPHDVEIPYTLADRDDIKGIARDVRYIRENTHSHSVRLRRLERGYWRIAGIGTALGAIGTWIVPTFVKRLLNHA